MIALLVYCLCPPFTSNDSYFAVPTALSLLRHGTMAADDYVASAPPASTLMCVSPTAGTVVPAAACPIVPNQWNVFPVNVDKAKWGVWQWSDPPFFRGLK